MATSQGINGIVTELKGNQMPMKGATKRTGKPLLCSVVIYETTSIDQTEKTNEKSFFTKILTKQMGSVETDSTGKFTIDLPVGKYSLFIKIGNRYYANLFDQFNNIALFEVLPNSYTEAKLTVNNAASY